MSVKLLDKTRKLNKLLHYNSSYKVIFDDICKCAGEILSANVLVISMKGKVLGLYDNSKVEVINELLPEELGKVIDDGLNERFLSVLKYCQQKKMLIL